MTAQEKAQTIVNGIAWSRPGCQTRFNVRDLGRGVWAALSAMASEVVDHGTHRVYQGATTCGLPWTVEVRR